MLSGERIIDWRVEGMPVMMDGYLTCVDIDETTTASQMTAAADLDLIF